MRIATWNVNGLRARLEFLLLWLREREPDVVGLQELKLTDEQFPRDEIESAGYQILSHGQKSWNGVAILSRKSAELVQRGLPEQQEMGARLISARIDDLVFATIYLPNGKDVGHDDFPRKLVWLDALRSWLESAHEPSDSLVLCGDFNVCPGPLDSHNEEKLRGGIFLTDEERSRFQGLIDWGLVDVFRAAHPESQTYSWWDYRGGAFHRGLGLRIDLMLATAAVNARVRGVEIDREYRKKKDGLTASDHAPVIVDLS